MDYDRDQYKVWKLPHPLLIHWVINPGLAFNELILGQRVPALTLLEKTPGKSLVDRQVVPCPSCGAMNDGRLYGATMFGNYAGLACVECGAKIPSLKNALTWLVQMLTWPFWKPFERRYGSGLLKRQHEKLQVIKAEGLPEKSQVSGLGMGLFFGVAMAIFFFVQQTLGGAEALDALWIAAISGLLAGVFFGITMKLFLTLMIRAKASDSG